MKSYTDTEQSKKLAEILPPESADMYYYSYMSIGEPFYMSYPNVIEDRQRLAKNDIPCWSLTALLDVLPRVDIEKELWSSDKYDYRVKAYIGDGYVGDWSENPIDACYEMITELHELNLL